MLVMRTIEDTTNPVGELVRLCLGKWQLMILTPQLLFLTQRLCWPSQRLTSLEICQLALSQMRSNTFLPAAWSFSQLHWRHCVVKELTGLPSTNLSHVWSISGR
jgi:hypothetical protein